MAPPHSADPAGEVFTTIVAEHVRRIEQRLPPALADEDDAVHRLRTAVRRLRTVLAVYRPVFERKEVKQLRRRLAELGDVLGEARDLEVRRADVESVGAAASVSRDARARLVAELDREHAAAHARFVDYAGGLQMRATTAELIRWVREPPRGKAADRRAGKVARQRLRKAVDRVGRAAADLDLQALAEVTVEDLDDRAALDDLLARAHRLRKAGRRLSQGARAVTRTPTKVLGSRAKELGTAGKTLQSSLGDHRDALLLALLARDHAAEAAAHGEDPAPYDRLARAATRRAADALADLPDAVDRLTSEAP
ncbi:CHAD domain-containing protein [Isoptericola sp. 178]|uniref:CHAD domain-containing protein n=1 Tax=Isoptericola sp. 178 TaxID=3064651 RepID=UPI00271308B1|nr:CHAD domain-containing protein [Isoptericola sp. 178]MDO8144247.1 CHAD domain-containing protein [Isoptericola sp. 178]